MPSSMPVPSRRALHALRRIAFGTSCTIVFGAGMITEDRRRRIQSARKIHDNARRIKTSRNYHSSGQSAITMFDEELLSSRDYEHRTRGSWPSELVREDQAGKNKIRGQHDSNRGTPNTSTDEPSAIDPKQMRAEAGMSYSQKHAIFLPHRSKSTKRITESFAPMQRRGSKTANATAYAFNRTSHVRRVVDSAQPSSDNSVNVGEHKQGQTTLQTKDEEIHISSHNELHEKTSVSMKTQQEELAGDIKSLLMHPISAKNVDRACAEFWKVTKGGLQIQGVDRSLADACRLLFSACQKHHRMKSYVLILQHILSHISIDKDTFYDLNISAAMEHLLQDFDNGVDSKSLNIFKALSEIYLYPMDSDSGFIGAEMSPLIGERLMRTANYSRHYDLTLGIIRRIDTSERNLHTVGSISHAIAACGARSHHLECLKYFNKYYLQTAPDQQDFDKSVLLVVKSAFHLSGFESALEVIKSAAQMAKSRDLQISAECFTWILNSHWSKNLDLSITKAHFEVLENLVGQIDHPIQVYGAVLMICADAGEEVATHPYIDRATRLETVDTAVLGLLGHKAVAMATRNDWQGFETEFKLTCASLGPESIGAISVFNRVLKKHAYSHEAPETELFYFSSIGRFGLTPNAETSDIMVQLYKERLAFDSVPRWMKHVKTFGINVGPMAFNSMLVNSRNALHLPFEDLLRLAEAARASDPNSVDSTTTKILRTAAIRAAKGDGPMLGRHFARIQKLSPQSQRKVDALPFDGLIEGMRRALVIGAPQKALRIYNYFITGSKRGEKPISGFPEGVVSLAIKASFAIKEGDHVQRSLELLKDAISMKVDIHGCVAEYLAYRISEVLENDRNTDLAGKIKEIIDTMQSKSFPIKMNAANTLLALLVQYGRYREGLDAWKYIMAINNFPRAKVDIQQLDLLLRANGKLHDCEGVEWVMETLCQNKIFPDRRFTLSLRQACRDGKQSSVKDGGIVLERWLFVLDRSQKLVSSMVSQAETLRAQTKQQYLNFMTNATKGDNADLTEKTRMASSWSMKNDVTIDHKIDTRKASQSAFGSESIPKYIRYQL